MKSFGLNGLVVSSNSSPLNAHLVIMNLMSCDHIFSKDNFTFCRVYTDLCSLMLLISVISYFTCRVFGSYC